uniref:Uncharacterized protein n=1 Tax=Anguilla anguilla TaxID=7936 RepID=A0A0E9SAM4_ANGAN
MYIHLFLSFYMSEPHKAAGQIRAHFHLSGNSVETR